ncbi:MAG: adenylosuccinate lyase [Roseobacter sp.]
MTIKTLAAAVALSILPAMGFAYECNSSKQKQASMTCAEGSVYDAATGGCVPTTG